MSTGVGVSGRAASAPPRPDQCPDRPGFLVDDANGYWSEHINPRNEDEQMRMNK